MFPLLAPPRPLNKRKDRFASRRQQSGARTLRAGHDVSNGRKCEGVLTSSRHCHPEPVRPIPELALRAAVTML